MDYFEDNGRLYEFTVVSGPGDDGYDVECTDMAADGAGLLGAIRVVPGKSAVLSLYVDVSVACLRGWREIVEEDAEPSPTPSHRGRRPL